MRTPTQITRLDEDTFEQQYLPMAVPGSDPDDGDVLWDHSQVETFIKRLTSANSSAPQHVWTVVEYDGTQYALPGEHGVNAIGHLVTQHPWALHDRDHLEVLWLDGSELDH